MTERMNRGTRNVNEIYTVLLLLAWNDIVTNGGKMSTPQQEEVMKVKASDWIKDMFESYNPLKDVTKEILEAQITKDNGNAMIRKAKEAITFVANVLNPVWKDPVAFASGTQLVDALKVCEIAAWDKNEDDKVKVSAKKNGEYKARPFDPAWSLKEWTAFRYLGLPSGRAGCIEILTTPSPHSGPRDTGISTDVMRANMAETGGRNQRRIANLKSASSKDSNNATDSEDEMLLSSLREQKSMTYHFGWSNEKERLEKLVAMGDSMGDDISDAEKKENRLALYHFLKTPPVVPDASISTSSKRAKHNSQQTPTVRSNSTPDSAVAHLPPTSLPVDSTELTNETTFPSIGYSPSPATSVLDDQSFDYNDNADYNEEYHINEPM